MTFAQRTLKWHPRQPPHPCATQQPKQQGFRLIVTVLGGQQHFIGLSDLDERPISRIPGGTLKAGTGLNLDANHL
jgi:hypothetical protein